MTDAPRDEVLRRLLARALDLDVNDLPAFLDEVAASHPELYGEVRARLTGAEEGGAALEAAIGEQATSLVGAAPDGPGSRIGPYRVQRAIGEGGMGSVYLAAHEESPQTDVCIKLLKRGMDTDALLDRFRREREILADLDHPYIARLQGGASTTDGRPYFVLEFVDGLEIDRYCEEHALSLRDRLSLFLKVCEAMQFAHQRLVVHRDLKPANILVTADGTPKLLDFGIAKLLDPDNASFTTHLTTAGWLLTPEYASPEQVRGERVTTASDVYSLSVLLYRLLTGHLPYEVDPRARASVERAVCETEPTRPSTHDRRLRGDLDSILAAGLRKEAERRYGSVQELALDIRRHLAGEPIAARQSTAFYRARKFVRRNPLLAALTAATILLAIAMSVQTFRIGRARDATADALNLAASQRDHAQGMAGLLGEVLEVSDTDITYLESKPTSVVSFGTGSFAISAWIRPDSPSPGVRAILDKRVPPYLRPRGFHLFTYDDRIGLQIADSPADGPDPDRDGSANYMGRSDLADGHWHHVVGAARRDPADPTNDRVVLYVDGQVDATYGGDGIRRGDVDCGAPLRVGHESDGFHVAYPFQGSIQSPALFGSFVDSAEVAALYEVGRRRRRPFVAHVPSVVASNGDGAVVPLIIGSRANEARSYVWSIGGLAGAGDRERVKLTGFDPTSGSITLSPAKPWAVVPIRIHVPADLGDRSMSFQVMVGSTDSGERLVTAGRLRPGGIGARVWERESISDGESRSPRVVHAGESTQIALSRPEGAELVCRLRSVDPISAHPTLRFDGHRSGEPLTIALTDPAGLVEVVGDPCDEPVLHELVVSVRQSDGELTEVEAHALLAECGDGSIDVEPAWPSGVPEPIAIDYVARTRANAFITDTVVRFGITTPLRARLEITDLRGRVVRRMELGELAASQHSVGWDGRDDAGKAVEPGLYAVRIYGEDYSVARWDDERGAFKRGEQTELVRTQVFRVRTRP